MAELHVIGQVLGASGFEGHSIFCKVSLQNVALQRVSLFQGTEEAKLCLLLNCICFCSGECMQAEAGSL
jgi:hypothetical protein